MHVLPGIAIEKGYVPLNVGAKFRIVPGFRAAKRAIGDLEVQGGVLGHAAEEWRLVLDGMGGEREDAVPAVRHGRLLGSWRAARRLYGSLSDSTRCPAVEYNPFPDAGGCAKLPWVRRGLRFTVSLRTGVNFLATVPRLA